MSAPLTHHDARLRGLSLHYVEAGEGPPLLLVHGILVSHKEWLAVIPELATRFRVIAPDLPGSGASEKRPPGAYPYTREAFADTLVDLLGELGIERAHVCGHSMGGSIALTLAADHPGRVDRLSVIDSASYSFPLPLKGRIPLLPVVGPFVFKRLYRKPVFRDYFVNDVWSGHAGIDLARVDEYYADFSSREGREAAYAALLETVDLDSLVRKIPRVRAKTLVLWGEDDRIFPVGLAHRLVRELPDARLEILRGVAHAGNEERPDEVARALTGHFLGASS